MFHCFLITILLLLLLYYNLQWQRQVVNPNAPPSQTLQSKIHVGYLPVLHEILPAHEMKDRYSDPNKAIDWSLLCKVNSSHWWKHFCRQAIVFQSPSKFLQMAHHVSSTNKPRTKKAPCSLPSLTYHLNTSWPCVNICWINNVYVHVSDDTKLIYWWMYI